MAEFKGLVTLKGNPLTLVGQEVQVGDEAPDFTASKSLMETVSLSDARGKIVILSVTPSLDTGVCSAQLRRFNDEASKLSDNIVVWNISVDLPPAIGRFCGAEGIDQASALSDYKDRDFAFQYGVWQKEVGLLARSVWVIDPEGRVAYKQIVPEMTDEPDYDAALAAARQLA